MPDLLPASRTTDFAANGRSMTSFWRAYGLVPGGRLQESADHALMVSGVPHPLFNAVHRPVPSDLRAGTELALAVQAVVDAMGVPLFWWAGAPALTQGLKGALESVGAHSVGPCPAMRAEIDRLAAPEVEGLEIREVAEDELGLWAEIAARGTDLPEEVVQALVAREPHIPIDGRRRRYLGCLGGRPVATACTVEEEGLAGVFAIAVLAEDRRRGIGAAMTVEPLRSCADRGCEVAMLQASPMGYPVYARLGFEVLGAYELFLMTPRG